MRRMEQRFLYVSAALVDRDGHIRLEVNSTRPDPSRVAEVGRAAAQSRAVTLGDLYWDPQLHKPLMMLSIPVQGSGAFIFTIDPELFLYPSIETWPVPSATGETVLVRRQGKQLVYLSNSPSHPRTALRTIVKPRPGRLNTQIDQTDFSGERVLGTILPIPDSPWLLIAKIDASEVDTPLKRLGWEMGLILALVISATITGAALVWRNQQLRMYQERDAWLRQMADETPALLWTTLDDATTIFINKSLADFVGAPQDQRYRCTWKDYLHPDEVDRASENFSRCIATGAEFNDEYRVRRFDGEYRWVVARGVPRPSHKSPFVFSGSLLDITERKRAESEIKDLSARLIHAQEEERTRLARELHDDLGQQIAVLSLALSNLKRDIPAEFAPMQAQSERIREKLAHLAHATRRISHELHPPTLEQCGLEVALRALCSELSALSGIHVSFHSSGDFSGLSPELALCAFRVAQEGLQNVAKHSGTDQANLSLEESETAITLNVSDRGRGMRLDGSRTGLGLTSMKERARLLDGTLEIHSQLNSGTSLILTLPRRLEAPSVQPAGEDAMRS
jgi:PAS domain S-box-containing protein